MSATRRLVSRLTIDRLPSSRTYASDRFCEMTTLTGLLPTWMVGGGAAPATLGSARAATTTAPAPTPRRCMQTTSRTHYLRAKTTLPSLRTGSSGVGHHRSGYEL